jgi:DNA repair exonuclease SbcCD ATPase subunit
MAEDVTSRLDSAVSKIAEEQARKFEELHATLEQRMNSVIEQRIEHAMQDTNASHEKKFHEFISTVNHEIEQKMAQAEMQASQEARAIAAQAIEEVSQKYDELRESHAQKPAPTQSVATMESIEQSIGTFREQMSCDVQRMVEDLMKKLDHVKDDVTIDVSDPRCDDIINQVQNLHSRLSEIEPVRQSCSPLLGRVGAYEAQGFAAKLAVDQGGALVAELSEKSASLLDRIHKVVLAIASAGSNDEDYVMSSIQVIEAQAASLEEKLNTLQTVGECGQPKPVAKEEIPQLSAPVDNLQNATPEEHQEKFVELSAKADGFEERIRGIEQDREANLGGVA